MSEPWPDTEEVDEERIVRVWRYRRLRDLGFTKVEARLLADDRAVDWHQAEHMIRDLGYTPAQAARILI